MATCNNYMTGNTTVLLGVKEASPRIPDPHLSALLFVGVPGSREKYRQSAAVLFCFHLNGNSERRINAPPKFSGTRDPLCFFPDNNVLWTFTSIKTDFPPNERRHCGCSCHAISTSKTLSNKSFSERDNKNAPSVGHPINY
jgi:hypothetical protein